MPLCQNCYPAWPTRGILTTRDGRCAYCMRYIDQDSTWGEQSVAVVPHKRSCEVLRARRLLSIYEALGDVGSPHAPLILSDVKASLAELDELEKQRRPAYEAHPEPVVPDDEVALFDAFYASDTKLSFPEWCAEKKKAPPVEALNITIAVVDDG